jgi:hypothetical protein
MMFPHRTFDKNRDLQYWRFPQTLADDIPSGIDCLSLSYALFMVMISRKRLKSSIEALPRLRMMPSQ